MTPTPIEAREVSINGHHLRCQVCDYTRFYRRETRMSTGASLFGQDWANSRADCFICEQCGYVHWFVRPRSTSSGGDSSLAAEIEDLRQRLEAEADEVRADGADVPIDLEPTRR